MADWWPFGKTRTIKCPDGSIAIVYKDVDNALPLELRNLNSRAGAKATATEIASGEISGEYQSIVSEILFAINRRNGSQVLDFRNAYLAFMGKPCEKADVLERAHNRIMDDRKFIEKMELRAKTIIELIKRSPGSADQIMTLCQSIMVDMDIPNPDVSIKAIKDARRDAKDMLGGDQ